MVLLRYGCVVTIHQMFIGSGGSVSSNISYKSVAKASSTSVTLGTHAADDYLLAVAVKDGSSAITVPSGWTTIATGSRAFGYYAVVAYKVAASGAETSGTWTGAEKLLIAAYDGVSGIGGTSNYNNSSGTLYWNGVTMSVTNGTSWVVGLAGMDSVSTGESSAPTGMTNRTTLESLYQTAVALHDSASGVSAWNQHTTTTDADDALTVVIELKSE